MSSPGHRRGHLATAFGSFAVAAAFVCSVLLTLNIGHWLTLGLCVGVADVGAGAVWHWWRHHRAGGQVDGQADEAGRLRDGISEVGGGQG